MFPKPFAQIYIEIGQPICYPPSMNRSQLEEARQHLQNLLEDMRKRLDAKAGYSDA
jgi:lysophospholipid acyltransferase (LPLAT)-like uncharacterized protein